MVQSRKTLFIPKYDERIQDFKSFDIIPDEKVIGIKFLQVVKEFLTTVCGFNEESSPRIINAMTDIIVLLTNGSLAPNYRRAARSMIVYILQHIGKAKNGDSTSRLENDIFRYLPDILGIPGGEKPDTHLVDTLAAIMRIPADTRVGFSTASLWVHACMTSAFATSVYLTRTISEKITDPKNILSEDFVVLRVAALLHDLGKPFDRRSHVKESERRIQEFLKGLVAEPFVQRIVQTAAEHHDHIPRIPLASRIKEGDQWSSGVDRISELVKKVMKSSDPKKYAWVDEEALFYRGWDQWAAITDEEYEKLTKAFLEEIDRERYRRYDISVLSGERKELALMRGDARSIKKFVEFNDRLNQIKGASRLVDAGLTDDKALEYTACKMFFHENIPFENIIFAGGGNIVFIIDVFRAPQIEEELEKRFFKHTHGGARLTAHYITFSAEEKNFGAIYSKLMEEMVEKKTNLLDLPPSHMHPVPFSICNSCKERPAARVSTFGEESNSQETQIYCESCYHSLEYGRRYAFKTEYTEMQGESISKLAWSGPEGMPSLSTTIIEFIAGHPKDEIEQLPRFGGKEEYRHLGIVKADGNNMAAFFAGTVSITDLVEKSLQTQIAVEEAVLATIERISLQVKEKKAKGVSPENIELQLRLGRIFAGGDDLLFVVPGFLGLPFAMILGEEFYKKMGGQSTLSAGVVSLDPKFPLRTGIELADKLLKSAKIASRGSKRIFFLDFDILAEGSITPRELVDYHKEFRASYLSRPLFRESLDKPGTFECFSKFLGINPARPNELVDEVLDFYSYSLEPKGRDVDTHSWKNMRNRMLEVLGKLTYDPKQLSTDVEKALAYILYQRARIKEAHEYLAISKLLLPKMLNNQPIELLDAFTALNMLGGGRL